MRNAIGIIAVFASVPTVIAISAPAVAADPAGPPLPGGFAIEKLADGVYAAIRKDPPGLMCDGNSVFIINDADVIVVDAPEATRDMLAALRKLTSKPVKYVVDTHWHDDHIIGNHIYREAYPGAEFIGHSKMREYLPTTGLANRRGMLEGAPKFADLMRSQMEKGKNLAGEAITDEERAAYQSDIKLVDRYMAEVPNAEIILPTLTLEDQLTLHRGDRTIDIRYLGRGHTSADLVVHLPREGIVVTGDLVVWPVPLVGRDQSHVADWGPTLRRILDLHPKIIVPGHGPVMHEDSYVKRMADLMSFIDRRVKENVTQGKTLEETRKSINLDQFRARFAGDSRLKSFIFQNYVTGPAVESAYRDETSAAAGTKK